MNSLGLSVLILALFSLWSQSTDSSRFWQIDSAIEIKVQKNSPPFQAFNQVGAGLKTMASSTIVYQRTAQLSVEKTPHQNIQSSKKLVILEPIIVKKFQNLDIQQIPTSASAEALDLSWVNTLPLRQRVRLEEAQSRFAVLESENFLAPPKTPEIIPPSQVQILKTSKGYQIRGPWEISGGLALTNDHSIDLRHNIEGSTREAGELSVQDGTYNINVASLAGTLVAKMYDKSGNILGEGNLTLQEEFMYAGLAPKLIIRPQNDSFQGTARNFYDASHRAGKTIEGLRSQVLKRDANLEPGVDETLQMQNIKRSSQTVARFEAEHFTKSNMVLISGKDFTAPVFPEKMVKALKEIVSEQLAYDLNNPDLPVVWGQVLLDGKPLTGTQVELETEQDAKIVYFDVLNLPDTKLKETSANGYFAIIGAQEGFHALIARRGGQYFAHNIMSLEAGTVSVVNLESTLKTKNVPIRVFDAFDSVVQAAELEMQSLEKPLHVDEKGWSSILLPQISRLSLMQVTPLNQKYLPAQYFYNDDQDFIHVPLVSEKWLMDILQPKWSLIDAAKGTVVGFVQDENFEVYLAGDESFLQENITYFDSDGKVSHEGVKGGGFIINNIDPDIHEVVVYGKQSEKISSRLLPVDQKSISILSFQEN